MSEERQKSQEQLAFAFVGGSEAPLGEREGAEAPMVRREAEDPAGNQRMMEEVCERGNRRKALKRVRANRGSPGIDAEFTRRSTKTLFPARFASSARNP